MTNIHPSAIVEDGASVGDDVRIGPNCIVGAGVTLGDRVELGAGVLVTGRTTIGPGTKVWPYAVVGGEPQDLSYGGEETGVAIGADCVIREYVTIHRGTVRGRGRTTIGDRCFLMIASHVAHDCVLGDHVILTNQATVGGHCELGDYVILGGIAAVQQKMRIGAHAFIGGLTGVNCDVIPFAMAIGNHARLGGLNVIGLKRRGFSRDAIHALRGAYRTFFGSEGTRAERLAAVRDAAGGEEAVEALAAFIEASGDRVLALPRRGQADADA